MPEEFKPIPGAEGWQLSNPAILPLAALRASLEMIDEVGMETLREKSMLLTGYMEYLLQPLMRQGNISVITPQQPDERGCQLSIVISEKGREVYNYLTSHGIICDWREPDAIRVAPVPFYNTFQEVWDFVEILKHALDDLK
ncbi:MAG: hypothetical protein D6732_05175 [Methanobacteriota archaeon]|nr:MAG: hypothetical protein D6732_05175 [Euryarchaeota archaeon]